MAGFVDLLRGGRGPVTVTLGLGIALHAMDVFLVASVMPTVVADIGGLRFYAWVSMLYMVGSIVGAASSGPLRAAHGPRRAYVIAGGLFLLGSLGCALTPGMGWLLVTRGVQGLGGGLIVAQSMALVSELYTAQLRKLMLASISSMWAAAALLGPALGGMFAEAGWWRGAFGVNVPIIALFTILAARHLPRTLAPRSGQPFPIGRVMLLGGGVLCVAGAGQAAGLALRLAVLALALMMVAHAFALDRRSSERLFPRRAASLRSAVGLAYGLFVASSIVHTSITVFVPLLMQQAYDLRPLHAGYFASLLAVGWTTASLTTARWHGAAERRAIVGGPLLMFAMTGVLLAGMGHLPAMAVGVCLTMLGFGVGMLSIHLIAFTMHQASAGEESITAGSIPTVRTLGIAFGSALAGVIANLAGLSTQVDAVVVQRAVSAVYAASLLVAAVQVLLAWRLLRAVPLQRDPAASPGAPGMSISGRSDV
ncbi:MAG: MFS transporter [Immundisolibacter sp.]|uniref:MFS transporter n=1 Tax=Immundisolibacter sp. TaxID=1934948 RepID=UPI003EE3B5BF